jgi:hypothetical protein
MARVLEYITTLEKVYEATLRKAISSKENKKYLQVLSELTSFAVSIKNFLNKVVALDNVFRELKVGRVCYKWFYAEDGSRIVLVRLNPYVSIFYDGFGLGVAHLKNHYIAVNDKSVKLKINNFVDEIPLSNVVDIVAKRSLIMKALSTVSNTLLKYADEFSVCVRQAHKG